MFKNLTTTGDMELSQAHFFQCNFSLVYLISDGYTMILSRVKRPAHISKCIENFWKDKRSFETENSIIRNSLLGNLSFSFDSFWPDCNYQCGENSENYHLFLF